MKVNVKVERTGFERKWGSHQRMEYVSFGVLRNLKCEKFFLRGRLQKLHVVAMKTNFYYMLLFPLFLTGCATTPPMHFVDSDTSKNDGLATGVNSSQFSFTTGVRDFRASAAAKDGDVGETSGEATRRSILFGLVEWGDNGVGTAAAKAGIKKVKTVQNGGTDILWGLAYSEQQTIVTGTTNEIVASAVAATEKAPLGVPAKSPGYESKTPGRLVLVSPSDPDEVLVSTKPVEGVQP